MAVLREMRCWRNERGLTLLEFVLVLTITALVMGSVAVTISQLSQLPAIATWHRRRLSCLERLDATSPGPKRPSGKKQS